MRRRQLMGRFVVPLLLLLSSLRMAWAEPPQVTHRAPEFDVVIETDVKVPTRDGTKLAADLYRPARNGQAVAGRFPTLLTRTPYNKIGTAADGRYYAQRGYVVVANDVRGRYASEGTWRMMADDPADGYDVVEWIAAQPWSDGKIGTFGVSYGGGTQHALAEAKPPHLTTMIPIDALSNCGISGMRHGGAFELRFMNWIFDQGATNSHAALAEPALKTALVQNARQIRQHVDSLPFRAGTTPLRVVPEYESWLAEAMRTGPESPFWKIKGMSVVDQLPDYADVPVLHITGWYDSWTRQVALNYEALAKAKRSPQRLAIGPWVHASQQANVAGEVEFSADAGVDLSAWRLRWYDRWLKGESNGVDDDPPVLIYVMGTGDDRKSATGRLQHGGFWRAEREWPLARARATSYYLRGDGTLTTTAPSEDSSQTTYTFDPRHPVPTIGGNISSNQGLMTNGGYDQRPRDDTHAAENRLPLSERRDVLVFRTEPLAVDLEVTGTVTVKLWVSSTAPDTDFTAKLIDEIPPNPDYPLGFDLNIGDSIIRARYRESLDQPKLMVPGEVYPLTITLYPTSNLFKKGHRLRVDVSSSNFPRFDVNPNTGDPLGSHRRMMAVDNTIFHDIQRKSEVVLPLVEPGSR
ncbi:CocE/NonD family hydrolase [Singulisphaera acidiphila]|uniref:Putative hydrolase, CocE/NonD family n=1 Tax=Singulisphaera acidiphila (strain ATCC BAA-1392 / DSM 18658 / VKM B-2454 / MOB10) TaxID=886293 RepID=L0DM32_SINAD|nr:CocE/NonD family hydrolase [Singulisphaera acidiphila]AGA29893.1 putative hydrolase, CocE/NonD family [Singulisphaera acidiphila DSM 18658]